MLKIPQARVGLVEQGLVRREPILDRVRQGAHRVDVPGAHRLLQELDAEPRGLLDEARDLARGVALVRVDANHDGFAREVAQPSPVDPSSVSMQTMPLRTESTVRSAIVYGRENSKCSVHVLMRRMIIERPLSPHPDQRHARHHDKDRDGDTAGDGVLSEHRRAEQ